MIQDSGSTSTLCAILTARERASGFSVNETGFPGNPIFRVYCSSEAHSSVDKAVRIAGIGHENLVKIPVDDAFSMNTTVLQKCIGEDIKKGYKPVCVVAALGTTGCTAVDPLEKIATVCKANNIWLHVDAAYAGSALLLPEYRWMTKGIAAVDSFVFNPHKWLFTNFDCSAYFVKDRESLIKTFQLVPEYLKSQIHPNANDYSNWGIQLGRRFRALKLWFVIRMFGVKGLQEKLRFHVSLARDFEAEIIRSGRYEMMAPRIFNMVCFRFRPDESLSEAELDRLNENLLLAMNKTGKVYLTHTRLNGKFTIRIVIAQTYVSKQHVEEAWEVLTEKSNEIYPEIKS